MRRGSGRALSMTILLALAACDGGAPASSTSSNEPPDPPDPPRATVPAVKKTVYEFATHPFPLGPGEEANPCFFAPFPADEDVAIGRTELIPSPGSHHLTLEYLP